MPPRTRARADADVQPDVVDAPAATDADSPKMMAIKAIVEAAETRIRTRVDSIRAELDDKLATLAEAMADVDDSKNKVGQLSADVFDKLLVRLDTIESEFTKLNGWQAESDAGSKFAVDQIATMFTAIEQRLVALENSVSAGDFSADGVLATVQKQVGQIATLETDFKAALNGRLDKLETDVEQMGAVFEEAVSSNTVSSTDGHSVRRPHILMAIGAVMADVQGIAKRGQMKGSERYEYRKFDDQAEELGTAFRRHCVMIQSTVTSRDYHHRIVQRKDGSEQEWTSCYLAVRYQFTSLLDGSTVEFEAAGEGRDNTDKATRKAMTMALKAALDQAFLLGEGDDPDAERPDASQPTVQVVQPRGDETDAQRQAREAFEARQRARQQQDTAAETPQGKPGDTVLSTRQPGESDVDHLARLRADQAAHDAQADPVQAAIDEAKATGGDPAAAGVTAIMDRIGGTPVDPDGGIFDQQGPQPGDPWDMGLPPNTAPTADQQNAVTYADQQNAAWDAERARTAQQSANAEQGAKLERARAALAAARRPGLTMDKLNGIIAQATKEGLNSLEVESGRSLRSMLVAMARTLAPAG